MIYTAFGAKPQIPAQAAVALKYENSFGIFTLLFQVAQLFSSKQIVRRIAPMVERRIPNPMAVGSSPSSPATIVISK